MHESLKVILFLNASTFAHMFTGHLYTSLCTQKLTLQVKLLFYLKLL